MALALAVRKVDFLVLGGGISGLSAVFYLQRLLGERPKRPTDCVVPSSTCVQIALLEASSHIGGWIHSTRTPEGSIHEAGPRSMRPTGIGRNSLNLASSLGLDDEVVPVLRSHPAAQRRFIYTGGKLHQLPSSFAALLTRREPFTRSLAIDLAREVFVKRSEAEDESMLDFGLRRFGKEITANMIDPLCRGVFAGKTTELSVRSCFPQLFSFERQRGSVILGGLLGATAIDPTVGESDLVRRAKKERWSIWSLKGGLQHLAEKLSEVVQESGSEVLKETPCTKIEFIRKEDGNKKIARVHTAETIWEAERLICAIPAANLAKLLPVDLSPLSQHLQQIPRVTAAVVNLEFEGSHLPTEGFGYLVPSHEPSNVLGVIFDSCGFPQHDRPGAKTTRMTCMMGGAWFHDLFGDPDKVDCDWLASVALETLKGQIGLSAKPTYCRVNLSKDCIPNYKVNHHRFLETIDAFIADSDLPLTLIGSSYRGTSVNDCIYNSRLAARHLMPDSQLVI